MSQDNQSAQGDNGASTAGEAVPRTIATRYTDTDEFSALARYIGAVLRQMRSAKNLNIADVANLANLSRSMVSKIENGQVTASLESLVRLTGALGMTFSQLFRDYDSPEATAHLIKGGDSQEVIRHGTKKGYTYQLLSYNRGHQRNFEPFLISMDDDSEAFPSFQHEGMQFIYMLEGELCYRHGKHTYTLEAGDSFTFDPNVPHGPERLVKVPIRFLAITVFDDN